MADNVVVWADIPATDLQRAVEFYAHVTGRSVDQFPGMEGVAVITGDPDVMVVSADIYEGGKPSIDGATIYLGTGGDIAGMLERVSEAGGEILQEPQFMGDMVGTVAFFKDSEGNRVGLQQPGRL